MLKYIAKNAFLFYNVSMAFETSFKNLLYKHLVTDNPSKYDFHKHMHNLYEILYFKVGKAAFIVGNKTYVLEEGDLIIIPPAMFHYISAEENHIYERYVLNFNEKNLPLPILDECFREFRIIHIKERNEIINLFERFDICHRDFQNEKLELAVYSCLTELLLYLSCIKTDISREEISNNAYVQKAVDLIDNNFCNIDSIDYILQAINISYGYFLHVFKEALKVAPMEYVRAKKLLYAQTLIKQGEKPTKVCYKCGFDEYTSFYRAYKNFFGMPPSSKKK